MANLHFAKDCVREYWHDSARSPYLSLLYDRNLARLFLLRLFPPFLRFLLALLAPISILSFRNRSRIKYLRSASTCEICGDILTISMCTRCPIADTHCYLLDEISISLEALVYFPWKNIFPDFHKINFLRRDIQLTAFTCQLANDYFESLLFPCTIRLHYLSMI